MLYSFAYNLMLCVPGIIRPDIVVGTFASFVLLALALVVTDTPFILTAILPVVTTLRTFILPIVAAVLAGVIGDEKVNAVGFGNRIFRGNYRGS